MKARCFSLLIYVLNVMFIVLLLPNTAQADDLLLYANEKYLEQLREMENASGDLRSDESKINNAISQRELEVRSELQGSDDLDKFDVETIHTYTTNTNRYNNQLNYDNSYLIDMPGYEEYDLDLVLSKMPDFKGSTFRGFSSTANYGEDIAVGDIVANRSFTSTSRSINFGKGWAVDLPSMRNRVFARLNVKSGKIIAPYSGIKDQAEIVMRPGVKFQVKAILKKENLTYLIVDEVEYNAGPAKYFSNGNPFVSPYPVDSPLKPESSCL